MSDNKITLGADFVGIATDVEGWMPVETDGKALFEMIREAATDLSEASGGEIILSARLEERDGDQDIIDVHFKSPSIRNKFDGIIGAMLIKVGHNQPTHFISDVNKREISIRGLHNHDVVNELKACARHLIDTVVKPATSNQPVI